MVLNQAWGEHTLPFLSNFKLEWRLGMADASLYQPDTREYRYERNNDEWEFSSRKGGNKRNFSELFDTNTERGVDLTLPLQATDWLGLKFKTGMMQIDRTREGKTRRFGFGLRGTEIGPETLQKDLETILTLQNIDPNGFVLKEITQSSDTYVGEQLIDASYGSAEMNLFDKVIVSAGARFEASQQYVKTFYLFDPDNEPAIARLNNDYLLPSFNSTIEVGSQSQIRFSYNKSVARPDFRELSPTPYIDDESGDEIVGNPDLLTTEIDSFDTRFEWYGHANESVSIATFYKQLKNPIEISIVPGTFQKRYDLAEGATIYGLELEWYQNLSRLASFLKNFKTGGNLTVLSSEVQLNEEQLGVQTNSDRPLQGQSPYVINLYLFYDNYRTDTQFGLLFNQLGERISGVGTLGSEDYYEMPIPQFDFTVSQKIWEYYKVGFKAKNLLSYPAIEKQEGKETSYKERPREYSFSLSASF